MNNYLKSRRGARRHFMTPSNLSSLTKQEVMPKTATWTSIKDGSPDCRQCLQGFRNIQIYFSRGRKHRKRTGKGRTGRKGLMAHNWKTSFALSPQSGRHTVLVRQDSREMRLKHQKIWKQKRSGKEERWMERVRAKENTRIRLQHCSSSLEIICLLLMK